MNDRYGFSEVPQWRSRGVLGVAIAAALVAEAFVATGRAQAAPADTPVAQEQAVRGPDGALQAPDIVSARAIARLQDERVEVIGERTLMSSTWAMPDGTMSTGQAGAPIWVRQGDGDGTEAADWAAVDVTLEAESDGKVRPKAHPTDLALAGAGDPANDVLVTMSGEDGQRVDLAWTDELPAPVLRGPRATYEQVQPGVDLVVEVTRTGYEQFFVLTDRPSEGSPPDLSLNVAAEGLSAQLSDDGGVGFHAPDGELVGSTGTPLVWDAAVDSERSHPVTGDCCTSR